MVFHGRVLKRSQRVSKRKTIDNRFCEAKCPKQGAAEANRRVPRRLCDGTGTSLENRRFSTSIIKLMQIFIYAGIFRDKPECFERSQRVSKRKTIDNRFCEAKCPKQGAAEASRRVPRRLCDGTGTSLETRRFSTSIVKLMQKFLYAGIFRDKPECFERSQRVSKRKTIDNRFCEAKCPKQGAAEANRRVPRRLFDGTGTSLETRRFSTSIIKFMHILYMQEYRSGHNEAVLKSYFRRRRKVP